MSSSTRAGLAPFQPRQTADLNAKNRLTEPLFRHRWVLCRFRLLCDPFRERPRTCRVIIDQVGKYVRREKEGEGE